MIRTTLNRTHIAHTARCVLGVAALTSATALIGGGLRSPVAAHAASIRPAATSAVSYLGHVSPSSRWAAYAPSPLNENRGTISHRPLHLFRHAGTTTSAVRSIRVPLDRLERWLEQKEQEATMENDYGKP